MDEFVIPDIKQLMTKSPSEINARLQSILASNTTIHQKIDVNWWLGLAESASARAFGDEKPDLEWAGVAITAYEQANRYSAVESDACMVSAMMLRARLIGMLGIKAHDAILDIQIIFDWFLKGLPMSLEEAEKKATIPVKALFEQHFEELFNLRKIKNRLSIFKELERRKVLVDDEIQAWLKIWDKLP